MFAFWKGKRGNYLNKQELEDDNRSWGNRAESQQNKKDGDCWWEEGMKLKIK